ncbi:hypothetical protein B0I35DRAFT_482751 [Stachybotrys elegans]|uniref:Tim44-like domain-containing protein n=1 Tax=Stachybotrys elegans TaxID=80388 RepID=A0A8K0SMP6_9HYPO|nr:hypothetical protein B0I35DRAFT_482751 [Stachybotrys elegans]
MSQAATRRLLAAQLAWQQPSHLARWTRPAAGHAARYSSMPSAAKMRNEMMQDGRVYRIKQKPEETLSQNQAKSIAMFYMSGGPLFPGTFTAMPFSETLTSPSHFLNYNWLHLKAYLSDVLALLSLKLQSIPGWTSRPRWKFKRAQIAPTAVALHREVLEAFAAGDGDTIRKRCSRSYAAKFIAAIERRKPQEQMHFEMSSSRSLFYPKLKTHRISKIPPEVGFSAVMEQAVVAVKTRQRAWKTLKKGGKVVPGSERDQERVEYVVLYRISNSETYKLGDWHVWGSLDGPTTMESYLEDLAMIELEQLERAGWNKKK